jgi:hypothetical protein
MIDSNNQFNKLTRSLIEATRNVMEKKTNKHGHDAVGHEDEDINNDGKNDGTDKYLHNRRKAIASSMKKEEVEAIVELSKKTMGRYINKAKDSIDMTSYRSGIKDGTAISSSTPYKSNNPLEKKLTKRHKGIETAVKKLTKEESEQIDEALDAAARYGQHHTAIKELMKSIDHHVRNHKDDALKHKDYRGKKGVHWGHVGDLAQVHSQLADIHDRLAQQGEYKSTMGESLKEAKVDGVAAGSMDDNGHLCATKVFHKEWAEGTPIFSQHAEPDANGDIAWYDVMFEHGIEKGVSIEDLDVLMSESHERHSKRKMKESVNNLARAALASLEEARGRPRKNPLPANQSDEPEPRQHIMQQLQRAKLSMRGGEHVTFKDGTKHHVSGNHAEKILAKYSAMKPAGKEEFQKKISASHAAFKEEL